MITRICKACNAEKEQEDYYYRRDRDTYDCVCKKCRIAGKTVVKSETHKICKHCKIEKPFSEYQKAGGGKWLQPYCKPCDAVRKQKYKIENEDKVKAKSKSFYIQNKDKIIAQTRERYFANPEAKKKYAKQYNETNKEVKKIRDKKYRDKFGEIQDYKQKLRREANPEYFRRKAKEIRDKRTPEDKQKAAQYYKEYRERNKEKYKEYREKNREKLREKKRLYCRKKNAEDIGFKIVKNLRTRIRFALKRDGAIKSDTTANLLGCSIEYFVDHFKSLFTDGMTWDRFMKGEIQIDHIKPCAEFDLTKEEEQRICFHYKNMQPLWELDNLKKGAKYG